MYVGQGPAFYAAFCCLWHMLSLITLGKPVEGERHSSRALCRGLLSSQGSLTLPEWHRVEKGGDKSQSERRGQASWQESESCLCAPWRAMIVSVVLAVAPVPSWRLVPSQALALG